MRWVRRSVAAVAGSIRAAELRTPSVRRLAAVRARAAAHALEGARAEAASLAPRLLRGDPDARAALARLGERALLEMRREVRTEAARSGSLIALAAGLDARFADTDAQEWLDDPDFDPRARVRVLEDLDSLNVMIGGYGAFFDALRPFLSRDGAPTRVLDLAAGHGGFALEAARIARREGLAIELCATDLRREYLDIGAAMAAREALDVRFDVQDALDLSNVAPGAYDVIVCTQSLHHFAPGLVAVLASEASRIASRGVVLIDGCRSRVHAALVGSLGVVLFQNVAFAHDSWVSFRRFFAPEELGLLAQLGPLGERAVSRWAPPTHCIATIETG